MLIYCGMHTTLLLSLLYHKAKEIHSEMHLFKLGIFIPKQGYEHSASSVSVTGVSKQKNVHKKF